MTEQAVILFFLILGLVVTLWLYIWRAKKAMEYKNDERWQTIRLKAVQVADVSNQLLIVLLAVLSAVSVFTQAQVTFTLNRVVLFGLIFIGLRNLLELASGMYFDKRL